MRVVTGTVAVAVAVAVAVGSVESLMSAVEVAEDTEEAE
jgi:hypothetical protein